MSFEYKLEEELENLTIPDRKRIENYMIEKCFYEVRNKIPEENKTENITDALNFIYDYIKSGNVDNRLFWQINSSLWNDMHSHSEPQAEFDDVIHRQLNLLDYRVSGESMSAGFFLRTVRRILLRFSNKNKKDILMWQSNLIDNVLRKQNVDIESDDEELITFVRDLVQKNRDKKAVDVIAKAAKQQKSSGADNSEIKMAVDYIKQHLKEQKQRRILKSTIKEQIKRNR